MATVFISYSRERHDKAKSIAADFEALGHQAWFDQDLTGGQTWWDLILGEIRKCDIFAFALTPESLDSVACKREYKYATRLGKTILPLLVADGVSIPLLPAALAQIQFVDYRREDRDALRALAKAITTLPASAPLPDPLPEPPAVPVSYLGGLREQIEAPESMSFGQQTELLLRLKNGLRNVKDAEQVRTLLKFFRARDDLYAKVADEIDALLAAPPVKSTTVRESPPQPPPPPVTETTVRRAPITPPASKGTLFNDEYPRFKFFSVSAFWFPLILAISGAVAAIIVAETMRMPGRDFFHAQVGAGFTAFFLLLIAIRLLRWRRHRRIRRSRQIKGMFETNIA